MVKKQYPYLLYCGVVLLSACGGDADSSVASMDMNVRDMGPIDVGISSMDTMGSITVDGARTGPQDMGDIRQDTGSADASSSGEDLGRRDAVVMADARPPTSCISDTSMVVALPTTDGLSLAADWYTGEGMGRAVILLHMIPPHHNRSNYAMEVIASLTDRGFAVLNLDRRGAGDSPGIPRDAYEGPKGVLDAKAAVEFLRSTGCVDMNRIAWVGASNGTTTVLDYTIAAAQDEAIELPAAIVYLTGGAYTENQHRIDDNRAILEGVTTRFVFSTDERTWSAGFMADAPVTWSFEEYDPGGHGTIMFTTRPESIDDFAVYLDTQIPQ